MARSLDLTHPYFVSIKNLVFSTEQKLVINPLEDEIRRTFAKADHLMIPFQTVQLIEELPELAGRQGDAFCAHRRLGRFLIAETEAGTGTRSIALVRETV